MEYGELTNPSAADIQPSDTIETESDKRESRLKKIGKETLDIVLKSSFSTGTIYGIAETLYNDTLPAFPTLGASAIGGAVLYKGSEMLSDKMKSRKEKRKAQKNPPENPETISSDSSVV